MDWTELENMLKGDPLQTGPRLRQELLEAARLGQILHRTGILADQDLASALDIQKQVGGLLGEILVQLGYCSEEDISWALGCQYAETLLGQVLLKRRLVTPEQLQQAYERVRQGEAESLPEVLVTSGVVTPEELTSTLSSQYQEVRLGQILFISGYLTEEQLTEGLRRQSETGELLGEALCALGHCDPTVIQTALSQQLGGG